MNKKFTLALILALFISSTALSQPVFVDNFDYTAGDTLGGHGWDWHSGTGSPITLQNSGLTYTGYPSVAGNSVLINGGAGSREDINHGFTEQNTNGTTIYCSFLTRIDSASIAADYFFHLGNRLSASSFTAFCCRLFVQFVGTNIRLGITNASNSPIMGTTNIIPDSTYLVILKYTINNTGSDECALWVFNNSVPPSEAAAGTPEALNNASAGQDTIDAVALRQGLVSTYIIVDGIRIANSWENAVPVELISFNGSASGAKVNLIWTTATEINNKGFEIQRKSNNSFVTIAFVNGNGTTSEKHSYNFTDADLKSGSYSYRLKQIDFDGTYSYSNTVEVEINFPVSFSLNQNYPNPFNPATTIVYSIPVDSKVSIKIFNVIGQEVAEPVNSNLTAGYHQLNFNASGLTSGVYFYSINAAGTDGNNFNAVRKMILTK